MKEIKKLIYLTSHRILLEKYIKQIFLKFQLESKKSISKIVVYGCSKPRYKSLCENANWYFFDKYPVDSGISKADVDNIPLDSTDVFLCIEVLQYIGLAEIEKLFNEAQRLIASGGVAIFSVPYLYPINHEELMRLADQKSYQQFVNSNFVFDFYSFGNIISIIHDLLFYFIYYPRKKFLSRFLLTLIMPLKYFAHLLDDLDLFRVKSGNIFTIRKVNK